ncbi:MAG: hypothetical protein ACYSX0_10650 [Planctomycetota bacterium]|jgi:hypothetical protein
MARDLPDPLQLREVKYGEKTTPANRSQLARSLLEAGRQAEALDLYLLANDGTGIQEMRRIATEQGRPILLIMLSRSGEHTVSPKEWMAAGEVAFKEARWREAFRCFTMAGDEAALERLRDKLPDYEIYVPQGK